MEVTTTVPHTEHSLRKVKRAKDQGLPSNSGDGIGVERVIKAKQVRACSHERRDVRGRSKYVGSRDRRRHVAFQNRATGGERDRLEAQGGASWRERINALQLHATLR